jgi:hypothetical protein
VSIYGGFFQTESPSNMLVSNSVIYSEYLNFAINVNTDCSQTPTYTTFGDIIFSNFTMKGEKYLMLSHPLINLVTINNITIDRSYFGSYARMSDANLFQIYVASTPTCKVYSVDDGSYRKFIFTNVYLTSSSYDISDLVVQYGFML